LVLGQVEFGELSDASGSDSEHEDDSGFDILSLDEIQALLVKLNAQHEQTVATASQARSRLQQEVLPFLPEARFEKRLQVRMASFIQQSYGPLVSYALISFAVCLITIGWNGLGA
jgi:hypothetical protein